MLNKLVNREQQVSRTRYLSAQESKGLKVAELLLFKPATTAENWKVANPSSGTGLCEGGGAKSP